MIGRLHRPRPWRAARGGAGLVLLAGLLLAGCRRDGAPADAEPALARLGRVLDRTLKEGRLPVAGPDAALLEALADPREGAAADYARYIEFNRSYARQLARRQGYARLPVVAQVQDDPPNGAWRFERWTRRILAAEEPLAAALALVGELPPPAAGVEGPAHGAPRASGDASAPSLHATPRLQALSRALLAAAAAIEEEALGDVPPENRRLLRWLVPWICRSNGRFVNRSNGAPPYAFYWTFHPADPFAPGAARTESGAPVPAALHSMTGAYHLLRTLAGEPVQTGGIAAVDRKQETPHPRWRGAVRMPAMAAALRPLRPLLRREALAALAGELRAWQPPAPAPTAPGVEGELLLHRQTPHGRIVVGGPGANTYRDVEALLLLDLGGADTYRWEEPEGRIGTLPLGVLVDLDGDDVYWVDGVGGPGCGILGARLLVDRAGNDRYCQGLSADFAPREWTRARLLETDPEAPTSRLVPFLRLYGAPGREEAPGAALNAGFAFGAGFLGIGVLHDLAGDDLYLGQKYVFGAAMWRGVGLLRDDAGEDLYAAGLVALGAAVNTSFALLDDRGGTDHYQCLGLHESGYSAGREWDNGYAGAGIGYGSSWRAEARAGSPRWSATAAGGLGLLHDAAGSDRYVAGSFGIASGYAGGMGALIDDAGNDTYFVTRGPAGANHSGWSGNHALGNGCHRGVGLLLDRAGDDRYSASTLGGGTAWDMATGYLLDLGGSDALTDLYDAGCRGNSGWGAAKAFAVSLHVGGADRYERRTLGNAKAIAEAYPGTGGNFSFFLDIGTAEDAYLRDYANDAADLSQVARGEGDAAAEGTRGLGLFFDGPWEHATQVTGRVNPSIGE